jgi:hypothetical protein
MFESGLVHWVAVQYFPWRRSKPDDLVQSETV